MQREAAMGTVGGEQFQQCARRFRAMPSGQPTLDVGQAEMQRREDRADDRVTVSLIALLDASAPQLME